MRHMTRRSIAVALVAVAIACGKDPGTRIPTAPGVPTYGTVAIVGPDNIAPGQSAQLSAVITLSDGMVKTASSATRIVWLSSSGSRLRVDTNGVATGQGSFGDVTVTAEATLPNSTAKIRGTREVTVQPAGTYRVIGTVTEADGGDVVTGARLAVLPSTSTIAADSLGRFRLYGVPPDATIRVTSTGYETLDQPVHLTANSTQDFRLNLSGPRVSLSGPYTLTIEADSSCAGNLPAELRQRSYDAVVTQTGGSYEVRLTEPRFRLENTGRGNHFTGISRGATATFEIRTGAYYYYYFYFFGYPDIAEQLSDGTFLVPGGSATTTVQAGGGVAGTMSGSMTRYSSDFPGWSTTQLNACWGFNNKFSLTPR